MPNTQRLFPISTTTTKGLHNPFLQRSSFYIKITFSLHADPIHKITFYSLSIVYYIAQIVDTLSDSLLP